MSENILIIILSAASVFILFALLKSGHFIRVFVLNALSGIGGLLAVYFVSGFIGTEMPLNTFTLVISSVGGVPGVTYLLLMNVLCIL